MYLNDLGKCYEFGIGIEADEYKAFECYQKSGFKKYVVALNNVGGVMRTELGLRRMNIRRFIINNLLQI